ncbi:MAG TPA: hypothetical protein DCQ77_00770 [Betaproteobacteria bacterium]|nr:hypothetical protein [Betaproteobacteria bacterium]
MSDTGIHIPHSAHHGHEANSLDQWVAIFTAILAALGAVLSYQGSHLMNEVLLQKNEAVLMKAHATDQWNYYQAVSTKTHLMELAEILAPAEKTAGFESEVTKYKAQKATIKVGADKYEQASAKANAEADRLSAPHEKLALAIILFQIAVALASVTALTKRAWLMSVAAVCGVAGIGLWGYGLAML